MARAGIFSKNQHRKVGIDRHFGVRKKIKHEINIALQNEEKVSLKQIMKMYSVLEKNNKYSPIKYRRMCPVSKRARGITSVGLSRIVFREYALLGYVCGYKKYSW